MPLYSMRMIHVLVSCHMFPTVRCLLSCTRVNLISVKNGMRSTQSLGKTERVLKDKWGGYHEGVDVDEHQTNRHEHVCHQREGSQVLQVGDENQQDEGRQEAEHVEAGVEARNQDVRLVGVVQPAADGGGVGCFHHLRWEDKSVTFNKTLTTFITLNAHSMYKQVCWTNHMVGAEHLEQDSSVNRIMSSAFTRFPPMKKLKKRFSGTGQDQKLQSN